MKKLLGVLLVATTLVASTFALDFSVGGRGLVGGNFGKVVNVAKNKGAGLVFGGGLYANVGLFGGFGVQAEANFVSNQIAIKNNTDYDVIPCNIVDVPVLAWYNFTLSKLAIGGGVGVNFSTITNNVFEAAKVKEQWKTGLAVGANVKFYFTDHVGLVIGANGVFDFVPTNVILDNGGTAFLFDDTDGIRKSIYGTIGVEYKFF